MIGMSGIQRASSAALETATAQLISAAPPPYTTRSSTTRLRTTQRASCKARLASSTIWITRDRLVRSSEEQFKNTYHLITSSHKDSDSTSVRAFLDDKHLVTCSTKRDFSNDTRLAQLFGSQILKSWYNPTLSRYRNQLCTSLALRTDDLSATHLNFRATNPPHRRQIVLHQQMIRFIVKAPLANDQIRASVLHPLDHIRELFLFILSQILVLFHSGDVKFMLCFGSWGLEWAGEDG